MDKLTRKWVAQSTVMTRFSHGPTLPMTFRNGRRSRPFRHSLAGLRAAGPQPDNVQY